MVEKSFGILKWMEPAEEADARIPWAPRILFELPIGHHFVFAFRSNVS